MSRLAAPGELVRATLQMVSKFFELKGVLVIDAEGLFVNSEVESRHDSFVVIIIICISCEL
jgi:predicted regulator of Ras-like GTPase activity (Roadblock/LC7/MglB family)